MSINNQAHADGYGDAFLNLIYEGLMASTRDGMHVHLVVFVYF